MREARRPTCSAVESKSLGIAFEAVANARPEKSRSPICIKQFPMQRCASPKLTRSPATEAWRARDNALPTDLAGENPQTGTMAINSSLNESATSGRKAKFGQTELANSSAQFEERGVCPSSYRFHDEDAIPACDAASRMLNLARSRAVRIHHPAWY